MHITTTAVGPVLLSSRIPEHPALCYLPSILASFTCLSITNMASTVPSDDSYLLLMRCSALSAHVHTRISLALPVQLKTFLYPSKLVSKLEQKQANSGAQAAPVLLRVCVVQMDAQHNAAVAPIQVIHESFWLRKTAVQLRRH